MTKIPHWRMNPEQIAFFRLMEARDINWSAIRHSLDHNPSLIAVQGKTGYTILHSIARDGGEQALSLGKHLLDHAADPNMPGPVGMTPLASAMLFFNIPFIRMLLDHGADPNIADENGDTPLHVDTYPEEDYALAMRLLLERGANPNAANVYGNTPLHNAYRTLAVSRESLAYETAGASSILSPDNPADSIFESDDPVQRAKAIVSELLLHGADKEKRNIWGQTPAQYGKDTNNLAEKSGHVYGIPALKTVTRVMASDAGKWLSNRLNRRPLPDDPQLRAFVEQIPARALCPPASEAILKELDGALDGKTPPEIATIYRHHGGMEHVTDVFPLRLLTPEEVLENIWLDAHDPFYDDHNILRRGTQTCLFWTDDGEDHAGMFLAGPLIGKIFIVKELAPELPTYRNIHSFYSWLMDCHVIMQNGGKIGDRYTDADYPSLNVHTEDENDVALSRRFFRDCMTGNGATMLTAAYALYLSSVADTRYWIPVLTATIDHPDQEMSIGLQQLICEVFGRRRFEPAIPALGEVARRGREKSTALDALRNINTPEARRLVETIRMEISQDTESLFQ